MILVPDSSHISQPLDLGIFGLVKRVLRDSATYALNVEELNDALEDVLSGGVQHESAPATPSRARECPRGVHVVHPGRLREGYDAEANCLRVQAGGDPLQAPRPPIPRTDGRLR